MKKIPTLSLLFFLLISFPAQAFGLDPLINPKIWANGNNLRGSWTYPPGDPIVYLNAFTNTRDANPSESYIFLTSSNVPHPISASIATNTIPEGAPYITELVPYYSVDNQLKAGPAFRQTTVLTSTVEWQATSSKGVSLLGDSTNLSLYAWPTPGADIIEIFDSGTSILPHSWPVRAKTDYDFSQKSPSDTNISVVVTHATPSGTTTKIYNTPWNIREKSFASYNFKPTAKGLWIITMKVNLDQGFVYRYTIPGHYVYRLPPRTSRRTRLRRIRVWIPAKVNEQNFISKRWVFSVN